MTDSTNALIIGSGVAGSLIARILVENGLGPVTLLEAGPSIPMRDPRLWLDFVTTGTLPYTQLYDTAQDFTATGQPPWNIVGSRIFGRGGSTIHWGGWCPRFMPEDFALYSNTGYGIDWPFSYADLEQYYCLAENYLQVSGDSTYKGRDWRSCPYPLEVAPYPITAGPIIEAMSALGYSYQHMPTARNTVAVNGQAQCVTNNTCDYCPIGARFTGDQPVDSLQSNPNFTLITSATATQILMSSKSTVSGVQYLDQTTGLTKTIEAQIVFLCAGALETPKLLLASQNSYWPNGIGNDNDLVGRYLVANPYLYSRGTSATNPDRLQQELTFPTLCSRQWDSEQTQPTGKFLMNMAHSAPDLNPAQLMYQGDTAPTIQSSVVGPVLYEIQGGFGPFPSYNNRVGLASGTNRFGMPRTLIDTPDPLMPSSTVTQIIQDIEQIYHQMGYTINEAGLYPQRGDHAASTCRMATSPDQGVVDQNLEVYGVNNLVIASNAVLPTVGAANPTLTLVAVIIRAFFAFTGKTALVLKGQTIVQPERRTPAAPTNTPSG